LHLKVNDIQHSAVTGLKCFDQDLTAQCQNEGDKTGYYIIYINADVLMQSNLLWSIIHHVWSCNMSIILGENTAKIVLYL